MMLERADFVVGVALFVGNFCFSLSVSIALIPYEKIRNVVARSIFEISTISFYLYSYSSDASYLLARKKESIVINENSSTYYQEINQRDWKLDPMKWTKYHNTGGFSFDYPDTYEVGLFPGVQYSEGVTIYNSDQVKLSPKDNNGNKSEMMRLVRSVNDKNSPRIENFAQSVFKDNTDNDRMLVNVVEPLHLTSFLGVIAYEFTIDSNGFSHVLGTLGSRGIIRIIVVDLHNQRYVIGYYKNPILERVVQSFRID